MRNRKHLFLHSTILRGRLRRDGEEEGGGTPSAGGDNASGGQGNSSGDASGAGESNNTGNGFDASSFWQGPAQEGSGTPSGESASGNQPESDTKEKGGFGEQLTAQLQGLNFGESVLTPEVTEQINNGDFSGFQKNMNSALQTAVRHSLAMNVQILRPFAEQLMSQMRDEIASTLNSRDNTDTLVRDFPAAKDPRVAPVIRQVFEQALKNTKGNREQAVSQTKEMIKLMANTAAGDLNLDIAPKGPGDSGAQNQTINWLDELSGR